MGKTPIEVKAVNAWSDPAHKSVVVALCPRERDPHGELFTEFRLSLSDAQLLMELLHMQVMKSKAGVSVGYPEPTEEPGDGE